MLAEFALHAKGNLEMKKAKARKSARKPAKPTAKTQKKKVNPIPAGYNSVTPYLAIRGAAEALEFYKKAFGAKELMRMPGPGGSIGHAEIGIGDSRLMLADEFPDMKFLGPQARGGTTVSIHVYVKDVDAIVERAVAAGAKLSRAVENQFYGDRTGTLEDPFGHMWHFATHVEDVSMAELRKRAAQKAQQAGG
jgi:PhnB protein